jgi:hypothetical protein
MLFYFSSSWSEASCRPKQPARSSLPQNLDDCIVAAVGFDVVADKLLATRGLLFERGEGQSDLVCASAARARLGSPIHGRIRLPGGDSRR